jgi:hypothetical protein
MTFRVVTPVANNSAEPARLRRTVWAKSTRAGLTGPKWDSFSNAEKLKYKVNNGRSCRRPHDGTVYSAFFTNHEHRCDAGSMLSKKSAASR